MIYYAHPMPYYGTSLEAADIAFIRSVRSKTVVCNPGSPEVQMKFNAAKDMGFFLDLVSGCIDGVFFRAYEGGQIGAGVAQECLQAMLLGRPCYQILSDWTGHPKLGNGFSIPTFPWSHVLTIEETRAKNEETRSLLTFSQSSKDGCDDHAVSN